MQTTSGRATEAPSRGEHRKPMQAPDQSTSAAKGHAPRGAVPATLAHPDARRFWLAVILIWNRRRRRRGLADPRSHDGAALGLAPGERRPSASGERRRLLAPRHRPGGRRGHHRHRADLARQSTCRQQHRDHLRDLVFRRPAAGAAHIGERPALGDHRRHGRFARARRRAQAGRRRDRQRSHATVSACPTTNASCWSRAAPAQEWPRSTMSRWAARCSQSKCCEARWRCGWCCPR